MCARIGSAQRAGETDVEVGVQLRLLPEPRVVHEEPSLPAAQTRKRKHKYTQSNTRKHARMRHVDTRSVRNVHTVSAPTYHDSTERVHATHCVLEQCAHPRTIAMQRVQTCISQMALGSAACIEENTAREEVVRKSSGTCAGEATQIDSVSNEVLQG
eukprot:891969-Rhodomonas_salina.1